MRSLIAIAAVCAAGIGLTLPANAAKWDCVGSSYVCGGASAPTAGKTRHAKTSAKASKTASYGAKKRKSSYSAANSTSGGGYSGKASYYWQPQRVASGGWFNPNAMTAAHKTLAFGTKVRVTNKVNGKSVVVTINDRGPYVAGRVIDLSRAAAQSISMTGMGVAPVSVQVLGRG